MGFTHYIVVSLVALLFTLLTWLGAGTVAPWLSPWALWMTLLLAECALLIPEQRPNESLFDARRRVWHGLLCDPLTWLTIALLIFLTIQWVNACTYLEWNIEKKAWDVVSPAFESLRHPLTDQALQLRPADITKPSYYLVSTEVPWPWLPWSYRANEARGVLFWFAPVLVALLAVRHALTSSSKRLLMVYGCVMTSVLAIAGIIQYAFDADFLCWGRKVNAIFFATFGYPNHAACFFPAMMLASIGIGLWTVEHREHTRLKAWPFWITAILCALSAVLSGSRAGMLFTVAICAFTVLYIPLRYLMSWPVRTRWLCLLLLLAVAGITLGTVGFRVYAISANQERTAALKEAKTEEAHFEASKRPQYAAMPWLDPVIKEIMETDWQDLLKDPVVARSGYQGTLALRQFHDYPWFGTGAWSFRWLNINYINQDDPVERKWLKSRMGVGQANVHNDTLQYLAEHGIVGFGLMLGCIAALVIPFLIQFFKSPAYTVSDEQADRFYLNRLNVYYVFAMIATFQIAFHSFFDLVFRSPACMMLYGLLFVCAPGFLLRTRTHIRTVTPHTTKEAPHA